MRNMLYACNPSYCSRILKLLHGDGHICRNRGCSCSIWRRCVADRYILAQSKMYRIVVAWLKIGCWFFVGEIGRPPSTGRALKDVPIAASTPFQGRGKALQFPMKIRYRELKRAFMDNYNWELCWLFQSENWKLSISTSRSFFQDFRSSSSQRPGISKYYEHGKALRHSGALRAPRNPNWVFHCFFSG